MYSLADRIPGIERADDCRVQLQVALRVAVMVGLVVDVASWYPSLAMTGNWISLAIDATCKEQMIRGGWCWSVKSVPQLKDAKKRECFMSCVSDSNLRTPFANLLAMSLNFYVVL